MIELAKRSIDSSRSREVRPPPAAPQAGSGPAKSSTKTESVDGRRAIASSSRAFIDSNVFVYAVDDGEPAKRDQARTTLEAEHGQAVISAQVLGEFYVTAVRKLSVPLGPSEIAAGLDALSGLPTISIDAELVYRAISIGIASQISYWDGLIVAAAEAGGCERLLTEDLNDGQVISGVRIQNPFA